MDIIFNGYHSVEETANSLLAVIRILKERYHIEQLREISLHVTLVNDLGEDVELVDSKTDEVYRSFEVYQHEAELKKATKAPKLRLVVDNTHSPKKKN